MLEYYNERNTMDQEIDPIDVYEARRSLSAMMDYLKEAEINELTPYLISFEDKETTLFEAVQSLFDDRYDQYIKEAEAIINADQMREDMKFEGLS
ncbi:MAG: hypothetical protein M1300_06445 [Epsilonproteobacteria bacterium]|nr:hypothetical protein [Campylobacterota bacterium]